MSMILVTKMKHAREFIAKGNKVRITCVFRGREMLHPEFGQRVIKRMCEDLSDVALLNRRQKCSAAIYRSC